MRLAFLIQCHKFTTALSYTVNKLRKSQHVDIYIHVDKKSCLSAFRSLSIYENVTFIENRVDVKWGGFEQIQVALNLFEEIKQVKYDYVSFISGDDIFYQSVSDFETFLVSNNGCEFIGVHDYSKGHRFSERVNYKYPNFFFKRNASLINRILRKVYIKSFVFYGGSRANLSNLNYFYKGSNWFTLTGECVKYFIDRINTEPEILSQFKFSFCGDELFFQTLIMDSPYRDKIYLLSDMNVTDNEMSLRYIDWCTGPEFPKILNELDLIQELPKNCFFLRKVADEIPINFYNKQFG